jgi:hypothetical protein
MDTINAKFNTKELKTFINICTFINDCSLDQAILIVNEILMIHPMIAWNPTIKHLDIVESVSLNGINIQLNIKEDNDNR